MYIAQGLPEFLTLLRIDVHAKSTADENNYFYKSHVGTYFKPRTSDGDKLSTILL